MQGKPTLTSVKLPESSLSHNLSFLDKYITDFALYSYFHVGELMLQEYLNIFWNTVSLIKQCTYKESFCQQNKNQLGTIFMQIFSFRLIYFAIFSPFSFFIFLKDILQYSFFLGSFLFSKNALQYSSLLCSLLSWIK